MIPSPYVRVLDVKVNALHPIFIFHRLHRAVIVRYLARV